MSCNKIIPFAFNENLVRAVMDEIGEPWFVAKDVAKVLEYSDSSNSSRLLSHVPDEWKGVKQIHTPGGEQEMLALSEQGLYFFLARSDKPGALPFQKWLAGEILPSLRKTGRYNLPGATLRDFQINLDDLPEDVQRMNPRLRRDSFNLALQTCRQLGVGSQEGLISTVIDCCRFIGGPVMPNIDSWAGKQREIVEYIQENLEQSSGSSLQVATIYRSFPLGGLNEIQISPYLRLKWSVKLSPNFIAG